MKVLIVDDEAPARDRLRQIIEESGEHSIVGEAGNGKDAVNAAARLSPDVVLLDIRMPGMSGIEAAHHMNELQHPPAVVFTTAYDEYAVEAFDALAVGYVLKPVRRKRLHKALEQAARISAATLDSVSGPSGVNEQRSHLCARVQGEIKLIPVDEIAYFQSDQKYTRVCFSGGQHLIDDSLKQLETEFADRFVRIHRSVLVAVAQIDSLHKASDGEVSVRLRGDDDAASDPLVISRRHVAAVKRRLKGLKP